jgi:hypothetical protein
MKIGNDIRLMSCGPRAGFAELEIPENEPGSSIMPGKVNPTLCEALTMIAVQVMANDVAVGFGGAGDYLEMNVYKPLIIFNITHSITIMTDGSVNFRKFLVEGTKPNLKKINEYVERSLERRGVCRDFAHLAVTLSRCMNIPARYCTGYLGDIGVPADLAPMDFSAWYEVFLDGRWFTFDARHNHPRIGRIVIAKGRDAADVAISTAFGPVQLVRFNVITDEYKEAERDPRLMEAA